MHHSKPQAVTLFSFNSLRTFCVFLLFLDRVFLAPTLTAADATRGVVLVAETGVRASGTRPRRRRGRMQERGGSAADGVEFDAAGGRDERLRGRTREEGVVAADQPEVEVRADAAGADPREGDRGHVGCPAGVQGERAGECARIWSSPSRRRRSRCAAGRARGGRGRPGSGAASRRCAAS
ncbi:hypothetical protein B0H17DRAFT_1094625 [Mycena rosella]|uniref:Uncharacterized protein n=1 Tax=Mycena rosella TaxID=1033263 RepID=A0AAD7CSL5_MYCRO|nr:hypothetical protein B0H17DRAFT_1094625 [Mycena rosella]